MGLWLQGGNQKGKEEIDVENIYPIYKKEGPTSFDVVRDIKKITGEKKVGHSGTLDPLARGILIIGVGRDGTKELGKLHDLEKEYLAEITLGKVSTTDDREGDKKSTEVRKPPSRMDIGKAVEKLKGEIVQTPPFYSAVKSGGQELYKYARKGERAVRPKRVVTIKSIEILSYVWPVLKIKAITGGGVYIRSLARDIGESLGTGGYLSFLERTRVGEYKKEDALSLAEFSERIKKS